ncbi:hypothetical protein BDW62DRAFT_203543 [Aspergillus aurantiobrunneus]
MKYHNDIAGISQSVISPPKADARVNKKRCYTSPVAERTSVICEILKRLEDYPLIRINGMPVSGKTTLMLLMVDHLLSANPETPIYAIHHWQEDKVNEHGGWAGYLHHRTGIEPYSWREYSAYLFFDEALTSYWDQDFWSRFFKAAADNYWKCRIILLTSYGLPGSSASAILNMERHSTPMRFGEFPQGVDDDFHVGVYEASQGHVGIMTSFCRIIRKHARHHRDDFRHEILTWELVKTKILQNATGMFQMFECEAFSRGLPDRSDLQDPMIASVLLHALTSLEKITNASFQDSKYPEALETIWKRGWLHAEANEKGIIEYTFATDFHSWYCACVYMRSPPKPLTSIYHSPIDLVIDAVRRFDPRQLSEAEKEISDKTDRASPSPLEDRYQKQLYRCLGLVWPHMLISPELSVPHASAYGNLDFYLPEKNWVIEFLRDSDQIEEHLKRFEEGGQYALLMEQHNPQYLVVNFTAQPIRKPRPGIPSLLISLKPK